MSNVSKSNSASKRNSHPTGADAVRTINEDVAYVVRQADFGFRDHDRGQTLAAVRIDTLPARGMLLLDGVPVAMGQVVAAADIDAGKLSYVPPANQSGNALASFAFSVQDSAGAFDSKPNDFCFKICPVNDAPIANDDTASTRAGTAVTIDVKANDSDPDNKLQDLKVTQAMVLDPSKGTVTVNADGSLTFTPAQGVSGPVELQYTLKDPDGLTDTAKVTVDVAAPDPGATQCVTFDFTGRSALDGADGNVRTYSASGVNVNVSAFARDKGADGAWSAAWLGAYGGGLGVTDSQEGNGGNNGHTVDNICRDNYILFEFDQQVVVDRAYLGYVVCDSDIKIWIGTIPDAFDNHTVLTDAVLASLGFTEVNRTTLSTARWADVNAGGIAGNVIIVAADTTDLTPEDQFKLQKLAVCTVPVADNAPEGADVARTIAEDTSYIVRPADFGFRDADPGQTLAAVRIDELPGNGRLLLNGVAVVAGQVILIGAIEASELTFVPDADEFGSPFASFTFSVRDSSDRFDESPNTFTLNVTPVNDDPLARPDTGRTTEDEVLNVATANGVILSSGNAASQDTDVDGDTLRVSGVSFGGTAGTVGAELTGRNGTLVLNADGSYTYRPAASTQGLDDGENVQDVFDYAVTDDQGGTARSTLTITVEGRNDGPLAVDDTYNVNEDGRLEGTVLSNDSDPDDEPLTVTSFSVAGIATPFAAGATADIPGIGSLVLRADGTFTFVPAPDYFGPVPAVSYIASDGDATATATLRIQVDPVNDAPQGVDDSNRTDQGVAVGGNVLQNDRDIDGDTLRVTGFTVAGFNPTFAPGVPAMLAGIGQLLIDADGRYLFTPDAAFRGPAPTVQYTLSDGSLTATANLTIVVDAVNQPPTLSTGPAAIVSEEGLPRGLPDNIGVPADTTDAATLVGNVSLSDPDGDPLSVTLSAPSGTLSSGGVALQWTGDGTPLLLGSAGGVEVVRVAIDNTGRYTVTLSAPLDHPVVDTEDVLQFAVGVTVRDGTAAISADLLVRVEDDAPVAANIRQDAQSQPADTNLMFVLDLSGSMNLGSEVFVDNPANPGTTIELTRLQLEIRAIEDLIAQYEGFGDVRVRIVTFSDSAQSVGTQWVDAATARAQLATLQTGNWTNYDAALTQAIDAYDDAGRLASAKSALYFLSDGDPTAADTGPVGNPATNPDIGIQTAEEAVWRNFLTEESITAFAIGLGNSSLNVASLDPVAFNGRTASDLDGAIVTDLSLLDAALVQTVALVASGQLAAGDTVSFGADGGQVASLTIDGSTYAYDAANGGSISVTGTDRATFDTAGNTVSVKTLNAGVLVVDLDDGAYRYTTDSTENFVETVQFSFRDNDGDTAAAQLQITVEGSSPNLASVATATSLDLRDLLGTTDTTIDALIAPSAAAGVAAWDAAPALVWADAANATTGIAQETMLRSRWEG